MVEALTWAILGGILSGWGYAILGLGRALQKGEKFEPRKFVQTLIIGGIIGGCAGYMGVEYVVAEEYLASIGIIYTIERVKKLVYTKLKG